MPTAKQLLEAAIRELAYDGCKELPECAEQPCPCDKRLTAAKRHIAGEWARMQLQKTRKKEASP